jgi:glycosyltransferase involved in cell wall biosynthesis
MSKSTTNQADGNNRGSILFVCTQPEGWGGSEFLWSQTAFRLANQHYAISAFLEHRPQEPVILKHLESANSRIIRNNAPPAPATPAGVPERIRRWLVRRLSGNPTSRFTESAVLAEVQPALVVISQQSCIEGVHWMRECQRQNIPYVTIAQSCHDMLFHSDDFADQIESAFMGAMRSYFVADDNRIKLETFFAKSLPAAEIVRNPFKVDYDSPLAWPESKGPLRLANVARLHIPSKGQDILLRLLGQQKWRDRNIVVDFFGTGDNERRLKQFAAALKLQNVNFCGHVEDIRGVWQEHHALLLPSRHEGLPIALVEAMLCGRPAVVTDVAGNPEVMIDNETGFIAAAPTVSAFDAALEKLWDARHRLQGLGETAATHIRTLVPADPVGEFASRLLALVRQGKST